MVVGWVAKREGRGGKGAGAGAGEGAGLQAWHKGRRKVRRGVYGCGGGGEGWDAATKQGDYLDSMVLITTTK